MSQYNFTQQFVNETLIILELPAKDYPGIAEILTHISAHFVLPEQRNAESIAYLQGYMKFTVDQVRSFHQGFYASPRNIPEGVFCAVLGGPDLMQVPWLSYGAQHGHDIVKAASDLTPDTPKSFFTAECAVRYYHMLDTLIDVLTAYGQVTQTAASLDADDVKRARGIVRDTKAWQRHFSKTPLAREIAESLPPLARALHTSYPARQAASVVPIARML